MSSNRILIGFFLICIIINTGACKKYLETKSIQTISTPSTLNDLQLLLDNISLQFGLSAMNTATDEYYILYSNWLSLGDIDKRGYVWDPELNIRNDWNSAYQSVFYANTVLFNLDRISGNGESIDRNNIKGSALFIRAHFFYLLAQEFAPQYDEATASSDLGIVLRLNADFNEISVRSSVKQTYQQIVLDLEAALSLLSETSLYKTRPGKAACHALLARIYLQMGNIVKAKDNADACLKINNNLIDYNSLSFNAIYPFGDFNKNIEILFYFKTSVLTPLNGDETRARIDSNLYRSFEPDDLRRKAFFKDNGDSTATFKGSYSGERVLFNGIALDEIYLIRAECHARMNNVAGAMRDLNDLLQKRWVTGKLVLDNNVTPEQALRKILSERRKELIYRGLRWADLKRLNKDSRFAVTLSRELNGQIYQLLPNDHRYSILIPSEIISLTNLPQNPR